MAGRSCVDTAPSRLHAVKHLSARPCLADEPDLRPSLSAIRRPNLGSWLLPQLQSGGP